MTKISILYPNHPDAHFDIHYYLEKHMPLAIDLLSRHGGYNGVAVEHGVAGAAPGTKATYIIMCHFLFNSLEDFTAAFAPHAAILQGDIPNYTRIPPVIQVSEVLLSSRVPEGALPSSGLLGVLETSLYVNDLAKAEDFYGKALGLPKIFSMPGRQLTFRCNDSILLIFNPDRTERERERVVISGAALPLHGARGPGHAAFRLANSELEGWRKRLSDAGIAIESEVSWPNGARSIYFRDPAGNSLELATPDIWAT